MVAAGMSLLMGAGASDDGVGFVFTARLGLRKRLPSFDGVDFLPSPSVTSASEVTSLRRSFLDPKVPKKELRRLSRERTSGVVAVVGKTAACAGGMGFCVPVDARGAVAPVDDKGAFPCSAFSSAFDSLFAYT